MNILSLFDGMSCGMLAMLKAGTQVDNYYAYEIDKYAVQTAKHNFPNIQELKENYCAPDDIFVLTEEGKRYADKN